MCVRLWFRISPREVREVQAGWQVLQPRAEPKAFPLPFFPRPTPFKRKDKNLRKASSSLLSPTVLFARFRALRFMKKARDHQAEAGGAHGVENPRNSKRLAQVDHINNEKRLMAQISYPFIVNMPASQFSGKGACGLASTSSFEL